MVEHTPLTVELYVRGDAPIPERRARVIERLDRLERMNRIDGYRVRTWPNAVSLDLTDDGDADSIPGTVRAFEEWADRHDRDLRPPFSVHTSRSDITGETEELLRLPVLCLAAYDGRDLVAVYPCCEGDSVLTVDHGLDALAAGELPGDREDDAAPRRTPTVGESAGATVELTERNDSEG